MPNQLQRLLEERAKAWSQVQDIQARREAAGYQPNEEDGATYTRALDDVERLSQAIETEERAERLARELDRPAPGGIAPELAERSTATEGAYDDAFAAYLRGGMARLTRAQQDLMERALVEERAGATNPGSAGGFLVPETFATKLMEAVKSYGGILAHAEVITTADGQKINWPTNDDTANVGAIVGENTQLAETDLTFGTFDIGAHIYTSKIVRVSKALLQDSAIDVPSLVARKLGERIGRAAAGHFASGTGSNQPQGLTLASKNVLTLTGTAPTYDALVDLEHSIDPAYRTNARYLIHDSFLREVRKLKDSQGRPLWVPAMAGGVPSTINGQPYTVDNSLPAFGTGSKSVIFGDIKQAYLIRQVAGAQTLRLDERYADYLQVGFLAFMRMDAKIQNADAVAVLAAKS